jgi:hypothetical protein
MPHDFPLLVEAIVKGLILGAVAGVAIILWRWFHHRRILPRRSKLSNVPMGFLVMGVCLFTAAAIGSAFVNLPSFSAAFGIVAFLYLARLLYAIVTARSQT